MLFQRAESITRIDASGIKIVQMPPVSICTFVGGVGAGLAIGPPQNPTIVITGILILLASIVSVACVRRVAQIRRRDDGVVIAEVGLFVSPQLVFSKQSIEPHSIEVVSRGSDDEETHYLRGNSTEKHLDLVEAPAFCWNPFLSGDDLIVIAEKIERLLCDEFEEVGKQT